MSDDEKMEAYLTMQRESHASPTCPRCGSENSIPLDHDEDYNPVYKCRYCKHVYSPPTVARQNEKESDDSVDAGTA